MAAFLFLGVSSVGALGVSPTIDQNIGYPTWYEDSANIRVEPCLDGSDPTCVLPGAGEEPQYNPAAATVFPTNFPSEFFYWIAESDQMATPGGGKVSMRFAVEGAFVNEVPVPGDQMVFGRVRITGTELQPNATYTAVHPYGTTTYQTDAEGRFVRTASTEDIGCGDVGVCNFSLPLNSRVFGGFLRWDAGAPAGYLGDGVTPHTVTGSPSGNNFFQLTGPGLPAEGLRTNLFTVSGKLSTGAPEPAPCVNVAPAPVTLTAPATGSTDASTSRTLSWEAFSQYGLNCQGNANQLQVLVGPANAVPTQVVATLPADATSHALSGLTTGNSYAWKVRATNGALTSDSAVRTFTVAASVPAPTPTDPPAPAPIRRPAAPTNLRVSQVTGGIQLNWTDRSNNETRFEIARKDPRAPYRVIDTIAANATGYIDRTAPASSQVLYKVRACNSVGCSAYTSERRIRTAAQVPVALIPLGILR